MTTSVNNSYSPIKDIIIAGGGIGGLTAALCLLHEYKTRGSSLPLPNIRIYERDGDPGVSAEQGYSLSIRSDNRSGGAQVLLKLGFYESMSQQATKGEGMFIGDPNYKSIIKFKGEDFDGVDINGNRLRSFRIARYTLRNTLLAAVPQSMLDWNSVVEQAIIIRDSAGNQRVSVKLSSGLVDEADVLIVADGSSSRIRRVVLPSEQMQFTGAVILGAKSLVGEVPPLLQNGPAFIFDQQGHAVFMASVDSTSVIIGLSYLNPTPVTEKRGKNMTQTEIEEFINELKHQGSLFTEPFPSFLSHIDPASIRVMNAMDKLPHSNTPTCPIIFIGDSCHPMSPFSGNGANMAMMDANVLSQEIVTSQLTHSSLVSAVKLYDEESGDRCAKAIQFAHLMIVVAHSKGIKAKLYARLLGFLPLFFRPTEVIKRRGIQVGGILGTAGIIYLAWRMREHWLY